MNRILLVVDMQEGFCVPGNPLYIGDPVARILPVIRERIEDYNRTGDWVFFTGDRHRPDDPEFQAFPPHCIEGTREAEIHPDLKGKARKSLFFPKRRFSGFHGTRLEEELERRKPALIEVVGVCTNICVLFTVEELRNRDYPVRVLEGGVASFDPEAHRFALRQMQDVLGAEIVPPAPPGEPASS